VHRRGACTLLRLPSDIWPRHYIGGLTGIFKPDSRIFRCAKGNSSPLLSVFITFVNFIKRTLIAGCGALIA
jgi:hypothetical protein